VALLKNKAILLFTFVLDLLVLGKIFILILKKQARGTHLLQNCDGLIEVVMFHGAGAVNARQR